MLIIISCVEFTASKQYTIQINDGEDDDDDGGDDEDDDDGIEQRQNGWVE